MGLNFFIEILIQKNVFYLLDVIIINISHIILIILLLLITCHSPQ